MGGGLLLHLEQLLSALVLASTEISSRSKHIVLFFPHGGMHPRTHAPASVLLFLLYVNPCKHSLSVRHHVTMPTKGPPGQSAVLLKVRDLKIKAKRAPQKKGKAKKQKEKAAAVVDTRPVTLMTHPLRFPLTRGH